MLCCVVRTKRSQQFVFYLSSERLYRTLHRISTPTLKFTFLFQTMSSNGLIFKWMLGEIYALKFHHFCTGICFSFSHQNHKRIWVGGGRRLRLVSPIFFIEMHFSGKLLGLLRNLNNKRGGPAFGICGPLGNPKTATDRYQCVSWCYRNPI